MLFVWGMSKMRKATNTLTHTHTIEEKKPCSDCFRNVGGTWTQNSNIIAEPQKKKAKQEKTLQKKRNESRSTTDRQQSRRGKWLEREGLTVAGGVGRHTQCSCGCECVVKANFMSSGWQFWKWQSANGHAEWGSGGSGGTRARAGVTGASNRVSARRLTNWHPSFTYS